MRSFWTGWVALLLLGCAPLPQGIAITPTPLPSATPRKSLSNVLQSTAGRTIIQTVKGRPWMMEAAKVIWNDPGKRARVEHVDWTLNDVKGKAVMRITAPAAWFTVEEERVDFEGKVHVERYVSKDTVDANKLVWLGKKSLLVGSNGVRWTRGRTFVEGDRMTATDTLKRIHVEGNVKSRLIVGEL